MGTTCWLDVSPTIIVCVRLLVTPRGAARGVTRGLVSREPQTVRVVAARRREFSFYVSGLKEGEFLVYVDNIS